ncbi:signal recognition particle 9 kD protein,putative [Schistosoma mansoni]|nr:signal recognition particle 9 kD protein,putative [Schistosoma mansoni]|eukprot:XP_018646431.1 signal recognition particle 9 kD protein,putative [Schistosoma mansoni]
MLSEASAQFFFHLRFPIPHLILFINNVSSRQAEPLEGYTLQYMTNFNSWEEFAKAAEVLYLEDPSKCRMCTKYRHVDRKLVVKLTDNHTVLKYVTDMAQDIKKIEKLTTLLMRHMASKEK